MRLSETMAVRANRQAYEVVLVCLVVNARLSVSSCEMFERREGEQNLSVAEGISGCCGHEVSLCLHLPRTSHGSRHGEHCADLLRGGLLPANRRDRPEMPHKRQKVCQCFLGCREAGSVLPGHQGGK